MERISRGALRKRPGLTAAFNAEHERWLRQLTPSSVRDESRLTYVGMDQWPRWQRCLYSMVMVGSGGLAALPEVLMWPIYKRVGVLGGAQVSAVDAMLQNYECKPTGRLPPLQAVPPEIGTATNVQSEWGALGELTDEQRAEAVAFRDSHSIYAVMLSARQARSRHTEGLA